MHADTILDIFAFSSARTGGPRNRVVMIMIS